jgi:hypothetical protein
MKSLLLPFAVFAALALPAAANAEACRDAASGKFAKCGAPGAVLASKYVKKGDKKGPPAPAMAPKMAPAMAPKMAPAMAPKMAPAMAPKMAPAMAPKMAPAAKPAPCKDAKGKFIACAPKMAPKKP